MSTRDPILNAPHDCTIVSWRVFDAPRAQVFGAWTDPELLKHWWGPKGFTNTFHTFEPIPGGKWNFTMHGPDGVDHPNEAIFMRVQPNDMIELHHVSEPEFYIVATFENHAATNGGHEGATRLTFTMVFETPEQCDRMKKIAVEGNEQNFDRLEAVLIEKHRDSFL